MVLVAHSAVLLEAACAPLRSAFFSLYAWLFPPVHHTVVVESHAFTVLWVWLVGGWLPLRWSSSGFQGMFLFLLRPAKTDTSCAGWWPEECVSAAMSN